MANITSTEVSSAVAKIIAARALGYLRGNTVLARIVNRDYEDEVATHGDTVQIQSRGSLTANTKAANSSVTLQAPSTTKVDVTLDQHKEVSFIIEDVARILARPDLLGGYMDDAMVVLAEDLETFLAGKYTGFSLTAIDASGTFDDTTFRAARLALNKAKVPADNRWAVLSPTAEDKFLAFTEVKNRDYTADQATQAIINGAAISRFRGFNVVNSHFVKATTGPNVDHNMFFQRNALTLVTRPLPNAPAGLGVTQQAMSEDGVGLRVTMSYNASYLGYQVTVDMLYGAAVLRANHGVDVKTAS